MVIDGKYCQISIELSDIEQLGGIFKLDKIATVVDNLKNNINLFERFRQNIEVPNGRESRIKLR